MSDSGGRPIEITDEQVLQVLREAATPVLTTSEVADAVDASRRTALRRLKTLVDEDKVAKKSVGARGAVWWITEEARTSDAPAAPLRELVGMLDPEAAEKARERSQAWRDKFNEDLAADQA